MPIKYADIKHYLQPPLDCAEVKDLRGQYFHNRLITNHEGVDFTGCVLYHCYPNGFANALEINPAQSEDDVRFWKDIEGLNLRFADLRGADLREVDLRGADLYKANLHQANLRKADLQGAKLRYAMLQGANLEESNLAGADLTRASFFDANLQRANLQRADLREAQLQGADLTSVDLRETLLEGAWYSLATQIPTSLDETILLEDMLIDYEDPDDEYDD